MVQEPILKSLKPVMILFNYAKLECPFLQLHIIGSCPFTVLFWKAPGLLSYRNAPLFQVVEDSISVSLESFEH